MIKVITIIVFLLSFSHVYGQGKKCKIEVSKNEYTGSLRVESEQMKLIGVFPLVGDHKPWDLWLTFIAVNDTTKLFLTHGSQSYTSYVRLAYFKFNDGTVFKRTDANAGGTSNNGLGYRFQGTYFFLSKEELQKFASTPLEKFYMEFESFSDHPAIDKELKEKLAKQILSNAACILNELH